MKASRSADGRKIGNERKEEREVKDDFKLFGLSDYLMEISFSRNEKIG